MSNPTNLSPAPFQIPVIDMATGKMTPAWQQWISAAFVRIGGGQAIPNSALTSNSATSALQATVATNTTNITTLQNEIQGLLFGRAL